MSPLNVTLVGSGTRAPELAIKVSAPVTTKARFDQTWEGRMTVAEMQLGPMVSAVGRPAKNRVPITPGTERLVMGR